MGLIRVHSILRHLGQFRPIIKINSLKSSKSPQSHKRKPLGFFRIHSIKHLSNCLKLLEKKSSSHPKFKFDLFYAQQFREIVFDLLWE